MLDPPVAWEDLRVFPPWHYDAVGPRGSTSAPPRSGIRNEGVHSILNGSVERYARNVKRWRGGQMIQRWVASALVEAEPRFRRARGYRDLRHLVGALDALAPPDSQVADVA